MWLNHDIWNMGWLIIILIFAGLLIAVVLKAIDWWFHRGDKNG